MTQFLYCLKFVFYPSLEINLLDFGVVQLGETGDRIFQIHNDGIDVLKLANIAISLSQFPLMTYIKTTSGLVDAIDPKVMQMLDEATLIAYLGAGLNLSQ